MTTKKNNISIPKNGTAPDALLHQLDAMQGGDVAWKQGKTWSLVYHAGEAHEQLLQAAFGKFFSANYLNPLAFKSLQKMEREVVGMTAHLLHGNEEAVGTMTSGGTESILLAVLAYRERARKLRSHIRQPEIVAPRTIHPAFDKAAHLFGLKIRKAAVDEGQRVIPAEMEKLIGRNTILLAASAPSYANGILDPIPDIGALAEKHHLPLHVDACIGGFMLPWVERLGTELPPWDFRVPAVTSISADVHKFGFGAKGASVVAYRHMKFLHHQFFITTDYPGGIYASPTLLGSRSGGPIAAAWAGLHHLGEEGFLAIAEKLLAGAEKLKTALRAMPDIRIIGEPCMNILSYTTQGNRPDIFVIGDQLASKGWMVDRQQFPDSIHLTVMPTNVTEIDRYLADLQAAIEFAKAHPEATSEGNAALYGLMARIPFRGMVEKNVRKIFEEMYGGEAGETEEESPATLPASPAWMGWVSRGLAWWKRVLGR